MARRKNFPPRKEARRTRAAALKAAAAKRSITEKRARLDRAGHRALRERARLDRKEARR